MTLDELVLAVHIVGAILWVGGGSMATLMQLRIFNGGDETVSRGFVKAMSWISPRWYAPASTITLLSGLYLVLSTPWEFVEPFVIGGLVLYACSMAIGGGVLGRKTDELHEIYEGGGYGGDSAKACERILIRFSLLDAAILWSAVLLMVFRP